MKFSYLVPAAILGCATLSAQAQNLMNNGSFETPGPGFVLFQGWENYGNVFAADEGELAAQDGTTSAKMFGQFSGAQNDQVLLETVTGINPNGFYTLSAYTQHLSADALGAGNLVLIQMTFQNAAGTGIETVETVAIDPSSMPADQWNLVEVSGIAPVGTTKILVALLHLQIDGVAGGASFWDNIQLVEGDGPCTNPADLNGDGVLNFFDISLFIQAFGQGCP